jgi:hypothetical protein
MREFRKNAPGGTSMTTVRSSAMLLLITSAVIAQTSAFRNTTWGMDRAQVIASEEMPPSQIAERGGETVLRYEAAHLGGLECRIVYILAQDKLVRAKYVFQREHDEKNDFLADFASVDAFLTGTLDQPTAERVLWSNKSFKADPQHYGEAVASGQLLYSTQWKTNATVVTHALSGENGTITHEIEYVSVNLESWENQVVTAQESPNVHKSGTVQTAAAPQN